MRIYTKIITDIETGEVLWEHFYEYNGPICHCKGGNSQQEMQTANQVSQEQLQITQQQLAKQNQVWGQINPILQQIFANGGMLPQQQAAETSTAMNTLPATYNNLFGQLSNQMVARGMTGGQMAGAGGVASQFGALGSQEAQQQAQLLTAIQNQKASQLFQGFNTALGLSGQIGQSVGTFNQGGISALGQGVTAANNADQAQTGFWGSLVGGLAGLGGSVAKASAGV